MERIIRRKFQGLDADLGIQALLVEGSNPLLRAMHWTKEKDFTVLSIADVCKLAGLEGIKQIREEQEKWRGEIAEEREYGCSLLRVEGYTLFDSFLVCQRTLEPSDLSTLSDEEFAMTKWFTLYVAHSPRINYSTITKNNPHSLLVEGSLLDAFTLQELPDIFTFSGYNDCLWLEGDLTKANDSLLERLFGQKIDTNTYKNKIEKMGFDSRSQIIVCPIPLLQMRAFPIEFGSQLGYSFSNHPFWYEADKANAEFRVDRIHVMPIMQNKLYGKI